MCVISLLDEYHLIHPEQTTLKEKEADTIPLFASAHSLGCQSNGNIYRYGRNFVSQVQKSHRLIKFTPPLEKVQAFSFYFLLVATVIYCLSRTVSDFDLWGHIKFGLDCLQQGHVVNADPYSYLNAGTTWMNHEWLSEVLMALAYKFGGTFGISFLRLSVTTAIFLLLFAWLRRAQIPCLATGILTIVFLFLVAPGLTPCRPQMFTYLLFAIELILLDLAQSSRKTTLLYAIPLLFALWINLHGGILAGLAIFAIWIFARIVFSRIQGKNIIAENKHWLIAAILSVVAIGLTPYGFDLIIFLLKTATVVRPEIPEWQPIQIISLSGIIYLLLMAFAIWLMQRGMCKRDPVQTLVLCACLALPFVATRHLAIAAIAILILCAKEMASLFVDHPNLRASFEMPQKEGGKAKIATTVFAATAIAFLILAIPRTKIITVNDDMPVEAVSLLEQSKVQGNMACFFDWGEYCIWHLAPNVKVSLDGRRETVYGSRAYRENVEFIYGIQDWQDLLNDRTNLCLASKTTAGFALMELLPDWRLVFQDQNCGLFARSGSEQCDRLVDSLAHGLPQRTEPVLFP